MVGSEEQKPLSIAKRRRSMAARNFGARSGSIMLTDTETRTSTSGDATPARISDTASVAESTATSVHSAKKKKPTLKRRKPIAQKLIFY